MKTYQLEVVEPSAVPMLEDMERRKLIKLLPDDALEDLQALVERVRSRVIGQPPSLDEITEEVEAVRSLRFARENES
jgi:hypothetical protein